MFNKLQFINKYKKLGNTSIIFLIVFLVLFFRRTDAFTRPQLYAEDYAIFLLQFVEMGVKSLIVPYGGYLHFVPRLIAISFGLLHIDYLYIPICYNYSAFLVTFFIALNIFQTSKYLNIKHRLLYATSFLLLPIASDIFMTITNINWITSLYLINYAFARHSENNNKFYYANLIALIIISLTGPFSTLLAPLLIISFILERKQLNLKKTIPLLIIVVGGFIQFIFIQFIDPNFYRGTSGQPESLHVLRIFTNNMAGLLALRAGVLSWIPPSIALIICIIVLIILTYIFVSSYLKITNKRKYLLLSFAIITFAAFIKSYWPNESKILGLENARYYFIPYTCIMWLLILSFDKAIKPIYTSLYIAFFLLQHQYTRSVYPDKEWEKQILEYYKGERKRIQINPEGWEFKVPDKR